MNLDSPVPLQSFVSRFGKVTLPLCPQILNLKLLVQDLDVMVVLVVVIPRKVTHGHQYHQNREHIADGSEDFRLNA